HFIPGSELLAHISGVPVGLAYSAGFFHCLELSEQQLDKLENLSFCRLTSQNSFISFIRSPKRGCLPVTNSIDRSILSLEPFQAAGHFQNPATSVPCSWLETATATDPRFHGCSQGVGVQHWSWPPYEPLCNESSHHNQVFSHVSGPAAGNLEDVITASEDDFVEEDLLRAGIMASLQDSIPESLGKVELLKSSVSSLRLQQLERMGFPTDKAVVALAATGKVEGAVSLLIEDQIGQEVVVKKKRAVNAQSE
ncbi:rhomboid domain-containing protein 3, partial [Protopterus annectens]|uniref:rhomboid domain-containing protein 3 n=1 Tax=Protopterus annectens TaxID=7888 RepID=UPI001CFB1C55